jgi:hypothetical protein
VLLSCGSAANILLNKADSDWPEVKLGDFGLSKIQLVTQPTMHPEAGTVRACETANACRFASRRNVEKE